MKRQKRGKCKLWRSFTNIFRRKRSTDEAPQPPFAGVGNDFPPSSTTEDEKIQPPKPVEIPKSGLVGYTKKPPSPIKQKPIPLKPAGQKFAGDLDVVARGEVPLNTDFAKHKINIKQKKRAPRRYNQMQGDSPNHSLEDLATVRTESQDESQNSKDDNSFNIPFGDEPKPDACSYEGELSSGSSDTAERSAKVALLPKMKPLPKEPIKKQDIETEEQADIRRVPSKKKMGSSRSEEAKKFQPISSGNEKPVNPEIVNLPISESQKNGAEFEIEAKTAKETAKTTAEFSTDVLLPETEPKSKKIRHSVSMKHLTEKDGRSGAGNVIADSRSKASAAEGSRLSNSAKEKKFASKTESLNVESKPEAEGTESSTLESKSKAAALPQRGSLHRLSKTEKNVKTESIPPEESKMGQENSLKIPQRRESRLKADGKRAESVHAPLEESSFKRGSSRRSSGRNSGQMFRESRDVDAEVTARNSAQQDTKKITENKKETQKRADSVDITPISTSVTDLPEGKELLTGRASGAQEEAQKAFHQSSNDFQVNVLQDPNKGSNLIECQSLTDDQTVEPVSIADSQKVLNVVGREDVCEVKGEKKNNQIKKNSSNRKPDFVSPAVPAKAPQKGKDMRNGIKKDVQTAAETETEIKRQLPAAENATQEVHKRMSKMPDEDGMKEFNKVLQKVQNKPTASNESTVGSTEALSASKTENKIDAAMPLPTEIVKPAKGLPVPPKANRGDASRNGLSGSQKITSGDGKSAPSANQLANLSSGMNSHSRTASITSGEGKIQSENSEVEKSKGDISSSSVKTKCPPPVVSRSGKVQPKGVDNAKEPDAAWIGKAKRMSKDFGDKMLQKNETKAEEKKADGGVETDDNFERGGTRSSVRDMVKKLQKQNQAS